MVCRGMKRPIRFFLLGVVLLLPSPVHGRTKVLVPAIDTPLTFVPPPNGAVVTAVATLNTRFEQIDAQTPPREESNRDPHLRIDSPRDGALVAPGGHSAGHRVVAQSDAIRGNHGRHGGSD